MTAARLCELFVMLRSFQSSNRLERVAILGRRPDIQFAADILPNEAPTAKKHCPSQLEAEFGLGDSEALGDLG